ncbi:MAG: TlpA family protein disulfide reductase [Clostridia bacterium]|nr:TlpA family protein disulfide reductase [Clostridia bacterium]
MFNTKKSSNQTTLERKFSVRLLACLLVAIMCVSVLAACGGEETNDDQSTEESALAIKTTYSVRVKTSSGKALSGLDIHVYTDSSLSDLAGYAKTNEAGDASFSLNKSSSYAIVISSPPKGYKIEKSYSFIGESATIVLESGLVTDGDLASATLAVGDVMYDFTVNTPDGTEIKLSEVLKTKKAVLLNFWYTTCSWCVEEFPIMNEVYAEYKDDIEIIAIDPLDDNNAVKAFQAQHGLDFPMASCPSSWANTFSVTGYPTSVIIDRYGTICVIEAGAITSKRPFVSAFEHLIAEDYEQKICYNGISDLVDRIKPNKTMPESNEIAEAINKGEIEITYRPETEDENAEYIWPFVITEKTGKSVICASNIGIDDSYAIIYADVTLKAGQAVGFDYFSSSERLCDVLYVIVNGEDVFQISGVSENDGWKSCYPCVAEEDGVYEVALCFVKDSDSSEGEDTVYVDNMRVVDVEDIDVETFLPREAAVENEDGSYKYVDIVFNEKDGYYHVGNENGPLLLANLMNYSQFNEEYSVYEIVYNGEADKDGVSLYDKENGGKGMVKYFSYASNSALGGVCTVNKELSEMLKQVAEVAGFDGDENEWLKICVYYEVFGPTKNQLQDPIKGLSVFSAFETKLGKNVSTNYFYYDRAILPRGLMSEFIPQKSGVYRFTSKSDYQDGIDAWLFDANGNIIYTYEHDERMYIDDKNCSIVYYMEAGTPYYVNMAFWDVYETGYIYYDVEYIGSSYELFRCASPGYFTYDGDATGEVIYDVISGGIVPELINGKYYDSEDGSLIYADFSGITTVFSNSILEMIEMGGFDFSKSESDGEILAYLKQNDNDVEKTDEYLKKLWGEEYDANAEIYQIDDIFAGRYHGNGDDYTEAMREYAKKIIKTKDERDGCVEVDEQLAEILTMLMDKYTFENVEYSWLKVCYYYDYLGPAK